jgi:folate-dependent phosphoribosylglycinamide formyltransferase PurN
MAGFMRVLTLVVIAAFAGSLITLWIKHHPSAD